MKNTPIAALLAALLLTLPAAASAQAYYYAPNTASGAYEYDSYIPQSAMPYVEYGNSIAQQYEEEYLPEYYPTQYQSESQSQWQYQYETSYPSDEYGGEPSSDSNEYNEYGEYSSEPQSVSYPTGTTGPFGTEMCYWSDYPTYAPCGTDPQQWIQDPYTGGWY